MGTLAADLSIDLSRTAVKVIVPDHDLACLMYYLRCVTVDCGLNILDDDLVTYKKYGRLSNERRALVLQHARELSPQVLIDKVIFRDDEKVITTRFRNELCDISVACGFVSVQRDHFIAGAMRSLTKVMFYQQSWLDDYYNLPMQRATAQKWYANPYLQGVTHYVAPLLYLTALFLSIFVYLSPAVILRDKVALLTIAASTAPTQPGPTDGLRLFLGSLGSCSKTNTAHVQCTRPSLHPDYDLSILPYSTPKHSITSLNTAPFIAFSFGSAFVFFVLYILTAYRYKMGKVGQRLDRRSIQQWIALLGVLGIIFGLGPFLSLRTSFANSARDFNRAIENPRYTGPPFVARVASGFIMVWVAYGFYAVAVFVALAKLVVHAERCFWST